MTIVKELNKLAEKITGTNPKATTDKKALDFIADFYANKDLKPTTNAQAIRNITDNFSEGGIDTSDATAIASDIVKDKTAYAKGEKIIGTYEGIIPSGTKPISSNGISDVRSYASVNVNVSGTSDIDAGINTFLSTNSLTLLAINPSGGPGGLALSNSTLRSLLTTNSTSGIIAKVNNLPGQTGANNKVFYIKCTDGSTTQVFAMYDLTTGQHQYDMKYNTSTNTGSIESV